MEAEKVIEDYISELIEVHVPRGKFFIDVSLTVEPGEEDEAGSGQSQPLPYVTLQTNLDYLKKRLNKQVTTDVFERGFDIKLVFDEGVPDATVGLLQDKIARRFGVDNSRRNLNVSKSPLAIAEPATTQPEDPLSPNGSTAAQAPDDLSETQAELARLELERARLATQEGEVRNERQALEARQQQAELEDQIRQLRGQMNRLQEEQQEAGQENSEEAVANATPEKTTLDWLRDFQWSLIAVLMAIVFIVVGFFGAGSQKAGLSGLSSAIKQIGEDFTANASQAGGGAGAAAPTPETPQPDNVEVERVAASADATDSVDDERFRQWLKLVEEKIDVLSMEGNFNFYRHYVDIVEEDVKAAAAILTTVNDEVARKLTSALAPEHMALVTGFLAEPGGLSAARSYRRQALETFFGRIAVDEYAASPLGNMRDAAWLFRLSNRELVKLALKLADRDRVLLLACFTPQRLARMIAASTANERPKVVASVRDVHEVDTTQIEGILERAKQQYQKDEQTSAEETRRLIDGPRFYARMITQLPPDERDELLKALADKNELFEAIKQHYLPFDTVANLHDDQLKEIFGRRPASQVAKILLTVEEHVSERILQSVPEALRDMVTEEVENLQADSSRAPVHRKESFAIQDEICRYLLKLNREGLLRYEEGQAPQTGAA